MIQQQTFVEEKAIFLRKAVICLKVRVAGGPDESRNVNISAEHRILQNPGPVWTHVSGIRGVWHVARTTPSQKPTFRWICPLVGAVLLIQELHHMTGIMLSLKDQTRQHHHWISSKSMILRIHPSQIKPDFLEPP